MGNNFGEDLGRMGLKVGTAVLKTIGVGIASVVVFGIGKVVKDLSGGAIEDIGQAINIGKTMAERDDDEED